MNILITGGCGFIGSHTVEKALSENMNVTVIDNVSSGTIENIKDYLNEIQFYRKNILDPLDDLFKNTKFDAIIHLAAQSSVSQSKKDLVHEARTNVLGTLNLLSLANKYGVKKFIFSSSSAVYGPPVQLPIDHKHPVNPISPYGISKLASELYIKNNYHLTGTIYSILRYSNVYGPRQNVQSEGGVISSFAYHITRNIQPVIFGDGDQTRDFIYVEDVAAANIQALKRGQNEIFNISYGKSTSINEVYQIMKKLCKVNFDPEYQEEKKEDIRHSLLDSSHARRILKWAPRTQLEPGIKSTIEFYRP